jgi:ankyrin repeat protein
MNEPHALSVCAAKVEGRNAAPDVELDLGSVYSDHDQDAGGTLHFSKDEPNVISLDELNYFTKDELVLMERIRDALEDDAPASTFKLLYEEISNTERRKVLINFNYYGMSNEEDHLSAMHCLAERRGKDEQLRVLLELGGNVNVRSIQGGSSLFDQTPLHLACDGNLDKTVQLLLDFGADVDALDSNQTTPLHLACNHALDDLTRLLLNHGADPNALDSQKKTPLHLLVGNRKSDSGEVLNCLKVLFPSTLPSHQIKIDQSKLQPADLTSLLQRAPKNMGAQRCIEFLQCHGFSTDVEKLILLSAPEEEEELPAESNNQKLIKYGIFIMLSLVFVGGVAAYLPKHGRFDASDCEEIYGSIILTPYLVVLVNQFLFRAFKWAFELTLLPLLHRTFNIYCCACCFKREGNASMTLSDKRVRESASTTTTQNPLQAGCAPQAPSTPRMSRPDSTRRISIHSWFLSSISFRRQKMNYELRALKKFVSQSKSTDYRGKDALLSSPWLFLYFQFFAAYIVVLACAVKLNDWVSASDWVDASDPAFFRYTSFYGILVNSSVSTAINSIFVFFWTVKPLRNVAQGARREMAKSSVTNLLASDRSGEEESSWEKLVRRSWALWSHPAKRVRKLLDDERFSSRLLQLKRAWQDERALSWRISSFQGQVKVSFLARVITLFLAVQVVIMIPPFMTHILPGVLLYGWILLVALVLFQLAKFFLRTAVLPMFAFGKVSNMQEARDLRIVMRHVWHLLSKVLQRFVFIFLMQTLFNYSALYYDRDEYLKVVEHEFNLRSQSYCFFTKGIQETELSGTIMLLSWL